MKKIDKLKELQLKAAEKEGWQCVIYDDGSIEFEKYSPLGEDFVFTVDGNDIAAEVKEYYNYYYDPDEHCIELIRSNIKGLPRDVTALAKDAHDIDDMLFDLKEAIDGIDIEVEEEAEDDE